MVNAADDEMMIPSSISMAILRGKSQTSGLAFFALKPRTLQVAESSPSLYPFNFSPIIGLAYPVKFMAIQKEGYLLLLPA